MGTSQLPTRGSKSSQAVPSEVAQRTETYSDRKGCEMGETGTKGTSNADKDVPERSMDLVDPRAQWSEEQGSETPLEWQW